MVGKGETGSGSIMYNLPPPTGGRGQTPLGDWPCFPFWTGQS